MCNTTNVKHDQAQSARAESTHKGVNQRLKSVTQGQQQRPKSPTVALTWHASQYKVYKLHQRYILYQVFDGVLVICISRAN